MDFNSLYVVRYRQGSLGVSTGYVVASSQLKAEAVGMAWCAQEPFRKYIGVGHAILADESILEGVEQPEVPVVASPPPNAVESTSRRTKVS